MAAFTILAMFSFIVAMSKLPFAWTYIFNLAVNNDKSNLPSYGVVTSKVDYDHRLIGM